MSNSIFPHLIGQTWPTVKRPVFSTLVQRATSGKEVRIPQFVDPYPEFDLVFDWLSQTAANEDFETLYGFFCEMNGAYDSFLFDDVTDDSVTSQLIGTGDSTTKAFQLQRTLGPSTAPVYEINGIVANYPISPPPINIYLNAVLQTSGYSIGTLPVISLVLQSGGTATGSGSYSLGWSGGGLGSGAAGTYTVSGGTVTSVTLTSGGSGYNFPPTPLFPSGGVIGASALAQVGNGGTLLFASAPGAVPITADFSYFFRCRFVEDQLDFENFASTFWNAQKVAFKRVRM